LAVGVIALVLSRVYPVGALPQEGPLRFGLPLLVILAGVAAERLPRRATAFDAAALATLALSSVWSLEAFALTAATLAVVVVTRAWLRPAGERGRLLVRTAVAGLASCAAAQLVFAAATLAAAGELPDWGQYFAFLHAFLLGQLGDLTYDLVRWSPGLAVGGGYLASAAALLLLVLRRRELAVGERTAVVAIAGTTAYGIFQFAYFVDRSAPHVLPYVCLPLLLAGALWLSLILRTRTPAASRLAPYALAWAAALAVLLVAGAWDSADDRIGDTALAHVVPGGEGPIAAVSEGERMLRRFMPGERLSLVLAQPNVANETLMRSGRANRLPIADAWEDSFVPDESVPPIREAVDSLRPGRRLLLDSGMVFALAALRAHPGLDPLRPAVPGSPAAPVQVFALSELRRRFRLEPIHRGGGGWVVMRLARR
jgi:hypothetical protein